MYNVDYTDQNCGCNKSDCTHEKGCRMYLNTDCIFYGLDANKTSLLQCIGIRNGSPLTPILENMALKICAFKSPDYSSFEYFGLDLLADITTAQEFAETMAEEFKKLKDRVELLETTILTLV